MDPKLRQRKAAEYLGVSVRTFRTYNIPSLSLPGSGPKPIRVYAVSELDKFVADYNDPRSRRQWLKKGEGK
jgi:hypothetical protein